jgi:hypothetical protein
MVLAFNPCAFVIAEHDRDLGRVTNVVRFEGEHLILYYNDRALYERTADHSRGGGHPILQEDPKRGLCPATARASRSARSVWHVVCVVEDWVVKCSEGSV